MLVLTVSYCDRWTKWHLLLFPIQINQVTSGLYHLLCILKYFCGVTKIMQVHAVKNNIGTLFAEDGFFGFSHFGCYVC